MTELGVDDDGGELEVFVRLSGKGLACGVRCGSEPTLRICVPEIGTNRHAGAASVAQTTPRPKSKLLLVAWGSN